MSFCVACCVILCLRFVSRCGAAPHRSFVLLWRPKTLASACPVSKNFAASDARLGNMFLRYRSRLTSECLRPPVQKKSGRSPGPRPLCGVVFCISSPTLPNNCLWSLLPKFGTNRKHKLQSLKLTDHWNACASHSQGIRNSANGDFRYFAISEAPLLCASHKLHQIAPSQPKARHHSPKGKQTTSSWREI